MTLPIEERILAALQTRLESITEANGYPLTVQSVRVNESSITFNLPGTECPLIEIIQDDEVYVHGASGHLSVESVMYLRLVAEQGKSDRDMAVFKAAVIRCLYANSYTGNSNAGATLADAQGNTLTHLRVTRCVSDLNMVKTNRIYALRIELKNNRQTWSF